MCVCVFVCDEGIRLNSSTKGEIPVSSTGVEPWERLGWLGAMWLLIDGMVAGEGSSAPADAVVGYCG